MLKLFRDYMFHQALSDGAPVLDAGEGLTCTITFFTVEYFIETCPFSVSSPLSSPSLAGHVVTALNKLDCGDPEQVRGRRYGHQSVLHVYVLNICTPIPNPPPS